MSDPALAIPLDIESITQEWPVIHDLEHCTFTYKGRSVPGVRLAMLLGLEPEPDRPFSAPDVVPLGAVPETPSV